MRLSAMQLEVIKQKYNVSRLWSWSMINTFRTSPYEYYLKYILHKAEDRQDCSYATLGGICHSIIEDFYNEKIKAENMADLFDDGWLTAIDIADLKFDRNDETKNANIAKKYKENLRHFFSNHNKINERLFIEKFMVALIKGNLFQGYIDAIYKDEHGVYHIIDWKTSTKYATKEMEEKVGQLVVYAIGLIQTGIPIENIRIGWNFLKYVTIQYQQKNGTIKTRDVERCKIGESLQANAKVWLKEYHCDKVDEYLKRLLDTNSIDVLPQEVQEKYTINDCYVYVPLTTELIHKWTDTIKNTIADITAREADYASSHNDKVFWDSDESVQSQSYYFSTLCGYSPNLHLPYKAYLEKLEAAKNGEDVFSGVGNTDTIVARSTNKVIYGSSDSSGSDSDEKVDLSWLDNI